VYERLLDFRRALKIAHNLPVKWEFHTKDFVLNKKPYRALAIPDDDRSDIIDQFCDLAGNLDIKVVNVAIRKSLISNPKYQVLRTALKFLVQRIENDLDPAQDPQAKFMIITDPGRVGKMRATTRTIQRINYIPSKFGPTAYRREIKSLIEDPLPKESKESYFVQFADLISYVVYLYAAFQPPGLPLHGRVPAFVTSGKVEDWLDRLKPSLNLLASSKDPYGVVFHP